MSTWTATNEGETCNNCQVIGAGDGEACQSYEITDLLGNRGSAVGYKITGNNFNDATSSIKFADDPCSQEAKTALEAELSIKLTDAFSDFLYSKPYVQLKVGDKFEACATFAATVSVHAGCCDDKPPKADVDISNPNIK